MEYFPFFIDIENAPCLVIGGGKTALHKIKVLERFKPRITVCSPSVCTEIREMANVDIRGRGFVDSDLDGKLFVVAATNDSELNARIHELCAERRIPVNCVDDPKNCTFIFPAIVKEKSVTAAVSTGGKSPVCARFLKLLIEDALDDSAIKAVEFLGEYREKVKNALPSQNARKQAFEALLDLCLATDEPTAEDVNGIIKAVKSSENKDRNA